MHNYYASLGKKRSKELESYSGSYSSSSSKSSSSSSKQSSEEDFRSKTNFRPTLVKGHFFVFLTQLIANLSANAQVDYLCKMTISKTFCVVLVRHTKNVHMVTAVAFIQQTNPQFAAEIRYAPTKDILYILLHMKYTVVQVHDMKTALKG